MKRNFSDFVHCCITNNIKLILAGLKLISSCSYTYIRVQFKCEPSYKGIIHT